MSFSFPAAHPWCGDQAALDVLYTDPGSSLNLPSTGDQEGESGETVDKSFCSSMICACLRAYRMDNRNTHSAGFGERASTYQGSG